MRIYFVIDCYFGPTGGTERQLQLLIRGLVALGHDVKLFVLRHSDFTEAESEFDCPIECLEIGSIASISSVGKMFAFRARLQKDRPEILHAFFNDSAILAPIFCLSPVTKIFTSRRDMGYWYTPGYLRALRVANSRVTKIICNCEAVARHVMLCEKVSLARIAVIYNASLVEPIPLVATETDRTSSEKCNRLKPNETGIRVCMVANLRRIKRVEDIINAAKLIHEEMPSTVFWIVGNRPDEAYYRELRSLADQLGIKENVLFLPPTDTPEAIMRECDIGVLASESEGLSNTVLEYLACGLPVVCSDVGGNPELVENGRHGFRYPVGDVARLASHLLQLCTDPALRSRMSAFSRERSMEFSMLSMIRQHTALYEGSDGD